MKLVFADFDVKIKKLWKLGQMAHDYVPGGYTNCKMRRKSTIFKALLTFFHTTIAVDQAAPLSFLDSQEQTRLLMV